jgi:hypothetical protein
LNKILATAISILALFVFNAHAEELKANTPLPDNAHITIPDSNVPPEIAVFSGIWEGLWENGRLSTIVVERIELPDTVYFIYSRGEPIHVSNPRNMSGNAARWERRIGKIVDGIINSTTQSNRILIKPYEKDHIIVNWDGSGGRYSSMQSRFTRQSP